jgi:tRNA(Ile2) C34 agmatinyltransferase TiaS
MLGDQLLTFKIANDLSLELPTLVQTPVSKQMERAKPRCKACGNPMKGHGQVKDCPRNKN